MAFPEILVKIHRQFTSGDLDGATGNLLPLLPLIRFEAQEGISLTLRKQIYYQAAPLPPRKLANPLCLSMPVRSAISMIY